MAISPRVVTPTPVRTSGQVASLGRVTRTSGAKGDVSCATRADHETLLQVGDAPGLIPGLLKAAGHDHVNPARREWNIKEMT